MAERFTQRLMQRAPQSFYHHAQRVAAGGTAFLHGAQDGQKFIGVFLLGRAFALGQTGETVFVPPFWLMLLAALAMGLGTAMGGRRIIRRMGYGLVQLSPRQGFASDLGAFYLSPFAHAYRDSSKHNAYQNSSNLGHRGYELKKTCELALGPRNDLCMAVYIPRLWANWFFNGKGVFAAALVELHEKVQLYVYLLIVV